MKVCEKEYYESNKAKSVVHQSQHTEEERNVANQIKWQRNGS